MRRTMTAVVLGLALFAGAAAGAARDPEPAPAPPGTSVVDPSLPLVKALARHELPGFTDAAAWAGDARTLVLAIDDSFRFLDVVTGEVRAVDHGLGEDYRIHGLWATADGKLLVGEADGSQLAVWTPGGTLVRSWSPGAYPAAALSKSGRFVAAGSSERTIMPRHFVSVWNIATGKRVAHFERAGTPVLLEDKRVVLASDDLEECTFAGKCKVMAKGVGAGVSWIRFSPDARFVARAASTTASLSVADTKTWKELPWRFDDDFGWGPRGNLCVTTEYGGAPVVSQTLLRTLDPERILARLEDADAAPVFSGDGSRLATFGSYGGKSTVTKVAVFDVSPFAAAR